MLPAYWLATSRTGESRRTRGKETGQVRRKVNGGLNGFDRFSSLVTRLEQATEARGAALRPGAIGPDVIELKRLLVAWGKSHPLPKPLKLTPLFGEATTAAVKAFQRANRIQPTGRVGKKTWAALENAVKVIH